MVSKKVTIVNETGVHARPAGVLVQTAGKFKCKVQILFGDKTIQAKSILNVMAAGIKCGSEVELQCDGEDEAEALDVLVKLIESGLGE